MNGESRRSREAVRNSIRTYGVKVMDPASLPLKKTKQRESQESVSRFSEKSLHSQYEIREGFCRECINRIPFATLIACLLCLLGVLMFAATTQRSAVLTSKMVTEVLAQESTRIPTTDILFIVIEIVTAFIAVLILVIGILSTGETRARVYNSFRARVGGRLCCAFLMFFAFSLFLIWILIYWLFGVLFFVGVISQSVCEYAGDITDETCLHLPDLLIFTYMEGDVEICGKTKIKAFCKDFIEKTSPAYLVSTFAVILIIISLVMFLICLAANYARIRCESKFQEIEELHHLDNDLRSSQDRF